jgi:lipid-A-disaccharide synthase
MLAAAAILAAQRPELQFVLPQADSISDAELAEHLANSAVAIHIVKQQPYDAIQCCDAVMTTSGTASLEIALLGVPMVIVYRLAAFSYWLGKRLVKIPFIGLPNIIAGKAIVKELIQEQLNAENLATEILNLLADGDYRQRCISALQDVKHQLGDGGGSKNMAQLALEMLSGQIAVQDR